MLNLAPFHAAADGADWRFDPDVIAAALIDVVPGPRHGPLLRAIHQLWPGLRFRLVLDRHPGGYRDGRMLAADGRELATDARGWLRFQLAELGGDAGKLRQRCLALGLRRTSVQLDVLYLVADLGRSPDDFMQLEIDVVTEYPASRPFGEDWGDVTADEVLACSPPARCGARITPPGYRLRRCEVISEFVQREAALHRADALARLAQRRGRVVVEADGERGAVAGRSLIDTFPSLPQTVGPSHLQRLFLDWAESSAGRSGARFCDHWVLQLQEGQYRGAPYCSAIPAWTSRKVLPNWHKAKIRSVCDLVDWLDAFDAKAGYPFAWYFYMLHGNRIGPRAGLAIAAAIRDGMCWLCAADQAVLRRYAAMPYGF